MLAMGTVFLKSPGHGAMSKTPLTDWVLAPVPDIFLLAALSMVNAQHRRHLIRRVGWDGKTWAYQQHVRVGCKTVTAARP